MTATKKIGSIIKRNRLEQKLSQKDLSSFAFQNSTSNALISRIENGLHPGVQFDTVYSLLLALNIDICSNL
jgi:transcriptional regulator with XRE-family HTH domain